jgi:amino-acid N-acetyltransferase
MAVVRKPTTLDLAAFKALLAANGQRTEDLGAPAGFWLVAHESGALVGGAGLEVGKGAALVRSLVVHEKLRRQGLGSALLEALVDEAQKRGCDWLYAFSTEAPDFFKAMGFRETTPAELAATLPEAPQVKLYTRLKWLETERAFRRDIAPPVQAA